MDRKREDADADSAAQFERFKEAARALGCDEDEAAFDEKLKAVARTKPRPPPERPKPLPKRAATPRLEGGDAGD